MDKDDVRAWVDAQEEGITPRDQEEWDRECDEAFKGVYGYPPDAQDRIDGVFSLVCAGLLEMGE